LELNDDAARDDGLEQRVGSRGGEKDMRAGGRLLERLEKGVRGLWLKAVGLVNDGDLAGSHGGLRPQRLLEPADLLDEDAAGLRLGARGMKVGMPGHATGLGREDAGGDALDHAGLAAAARSAEQIGMGEPAGRLCLEEPVKRALRRECHA
jgi:hypothetical protein